MNDQLERWRAFGPQIETRYTAMGMTQAQFCFAAGVSDTWLRPIIRGAAEAVPRPATLSRVSRALGWPADALAMHVNAGLPLPDGDPPDGGPGTSTLSELQLAARIGKLAPEDRAVLEAMVERLLDED